MAHESDALTKLQTALTGLLRREIEASLAGVEAVMARWRSGALDPFEAHAEMMRHAGRSERVAARIAEVRPEAAGPVLRCAFDAGLLERDDFVTLVGRPPEEVAPARLGDDVGSSGAPDKREFVEKLLGEGPVLVHIDARGEAVSVPERFRGDPKLVLRFGWGLSPAIHDLELGLGGLAGTLTFGGVPFHCVVPWTAVYAAVAEGEQRGMVWPDDVPSVVLEQMSQRPARASTPPPAAADKEPTSRSGEDADTPRARPSHLKLVE